MTEERVDDEWDDLDYDYDALAAAGYLAPPNQEHIQRQALRTRIETLIRQADIVTRSDLQRALDDTTDRPHIPNPRDVPCRECGAAVGQVCDYPYWEHDIRGPHPVRVGDWKASRRDQP